MFKRLICALAAAAAVLAAGALPGYIVGATPTLPVTTPQTVEYRPSVSAAGTLAARECYDLVASGTYRVEEVCKAAGERVAAGAVIAVLGQAEGAVYSIAAGASGDDTAMLESLAGQYGIDLSGALGGILGGMAEPLEQSESVTSPIDGFIISEIAPCGSVVTSGGRVCTVQSAEDLLAVVQVPERRISEISLGDEADISLTGGETLHGWVSRIAPTAAATLSGASYATTVAVEISPYYLPGNIRAGGSVSAIIYTDEPQTLVTVPYEAVLQDNATNAEYVFLATADGYERRDILTGREFSGGVEVVSGLDACEAVLEVSGTAPDTEKRYRLEVG